MPFFRPHSIRILWRTEVVHLPPVHTHTHIRTCLALLLAQLFHFHFHSGSPQLLYAATQETLGSHKTLRYIKYIWVCLRLCLCVSRSHLNCVCSFAPIASDWPVSPATFCSQVTKCPLPLGCVCALQLFRFINKNIVDYNFHFLKSIIIFSVVFSSVSGLREATAICAEKVSATRGHVWRN